VLTGRSRAVTGRVRLLLIGLAVVIAVVAFLAAKPGSGKHNAGGTTSGRTASASGRAGAAQGGGSAIPHILVRGGKPVGGVRTITVTQGERARFEVTSDVAEEVHVHGYDLHKDVAADGTVSFDFQASISGVFVIELEGRSEQIASLRVEP
jgi:hypothetical protein